jgi:hypothetical protein
VATSRSSFVERDLVPALSTRRPPAPSFGVAASLQASTVPNSALPEVRGRIPFPSSPDPDADWDTPAYQRRNGG